MATLHFIFTAIFSLVFFSPSLYAFSLGPINVKNDFGERFNAEIVVTVEDGSNARFRIGTQKDYERLGLKRLDIVDELEIKSALEWMGENKIIRVVSSRPLFYPSFDLLIRAENDVGTILENYFVAVDFQRNLSLAVKGEKVREEKDETKDEAKNKKKPQGNVEDLPSALAIPPATTQSTSSKNNKESNDLAKTVSPEAKAPPIDPVATQGKTYGPVARGESLWRIAGKLGYGESDLMRVAVAIWMDNRSKFANGNIHGIKTSESLNLENLEKLMAQVSLNTAKETIRGQLHEWKQRNPVLEQQTSGDSGNKNPSVTGQDSTGILSMLEGWRESWEAGDWDRHKSYFSNGSQSAKQTKTLDWKENKKWLFNHHRNVKIRIERPVAVQEKDRWVVTFDQSFHSDQMDTFGRKSLDLIQEGSDWKIVNEEFARIKREVKGTEVVTPPPPSSENIKSELLLVLQDWRESWEAGDFDRHMDLFSKKPISRRPDGLKTPFEAWKNIKMRMFDRHKNVEIRLGVPVFKPSGDRWMLSCDQTFRSDKMKTFGRKNIEFVREGSGWKITKEEFVPASPQTGKE